MPYVRTPAGTTLYCETLGTGPPVLFMTGSDSDLRGHAEVTPFIAPLVRAFTVLAYDPRGLGSSPPGLGDPTMADFADDARGVMDAVGWERALVLGYSFGGMVAQELALRHPDRIERLVLLSTSSGGRGGASYPLHELAGIAAEERHRRSIELWDTRRDEAWRAEHPQEYAAAVAEQERVEVAAREPRRAAGMAQQLEARRHHDTFARLPAVGVPTLVVGGRHDAIAPPANQEALAGQMSSASLAMFDGGHRVLWESAEAARAIAAFLEHGEPPRAN